MYGRYKMNLFDTHVDTGHQNNNTDTEEVESCRQDKKENNETGFISVPVIVGDRLSLSIKIHN